MKYLTQQTASLTHFNTSMVMFYKYLEIKRELDLVEHLLSNTQLANFISLSLILFLELIKRAVLYLLYLLQRESLKIGKVSI